MVVLLTTTNEVIKLIGRFTVTVPTGDFAESGQIFLQGPTKRL